MRRRFAISALAGSILALGGLGSFLGREARSANRPAFASISTLETKKHHYRPNDFFVVTIKLADGSSGTFPAINADFSNVQATYIDSSSPASRTPWVVISARTNKAATKLFLVALARAPTRMLAGRRRPEPPKKEEDHDTGTGTILVTTTDPNNPNTIVTSTNPDDSTSNANAGNNIPVEPLDP